MSTRIHKYEIPAPITYNIPVVVALPVGAKVLMVGTQLDLGNDELIYLWVEINTSAPMVQSHFMVLATGSSVPWNADHVGSVAFTTQHLVFHIYQLHAGYIQPKYSD